MSPECNRDQTLDIIGAINVVPVYNPHNLWGLYIYLH